MKIDFEKFLFEYFAENNPTILDDNLPDTTADWIGDLEPDEWIRLADMYVKKIVSRFYTEKIIALLTKENNEKIQ